MGVSYLYSHLTLLVTLLAFSALINPTLGCFPKKNKKFISYRSGHYKQPPTYICADYWNAEKQHRCKVKIEVSGKKTHFSPYTGNQYPTGPGIEISKHWRTWPARKQPWLAKPAVFVVGKQNIMTTTVPFPKFLADKPTQEVVSVGEPRVSPVRQSNRYLTIQEPRQTKSMIKAQHPVFVIEKPLAEIVDRSPMVQQPHRYVAHKSQFQAKPPSADQYYIQQPNPEMEYYYLPQEPKQQMYYQRSPSLPQSQVYSSHQQQQLQVVDPYDIPMADQPKLSKKEEKKEEKETFYIPEILDETPDETNGEIVMMESGDVKIVKRLKPGSFFSRRSAVNSQRFRTPRSTTTRTTTTTTSAPSFRALRQPPPHPSRALRRRPPPIQIVNQPQAQLRLRSAPLAKTETYRVPIYRYKGKPKVSKKSTKPNLFLPPWLCQGRSDC